jgi:diaminopimelate decarboxylase
VHIGSQITDVTPFAAAMERVAELIRGLRTDGPQIKYVDAGGGLGISYKDENLPELSAQAKTYADALTSPLRDLNLHLLLEPGRSIVAPAGVLLTRVLYRKTNNGKKFLIVDAAMNDLIRPSLYQAYHEIAPIASTSADIETTDVVGPVCETGDFFARDRELPVVDEGALLALLDAGAYGLVLSSNYNTRPRPAEVLVDGSKFQVIRRRESVSDLLRAEKQ